MGLPPSPPSQKGLSPILLLGLKWKRTRCHRHSSAGDSEGEKRKREVPPFSSLLPKHSDRQRGLPFPFGVSDQTEVESLPPPPSSLLLFPQERFSLRREKEEEEEENALDQERGGRRKEKGRGGGWLFLVPPPLFFTPKDTSGTPSRTEERERKEKGLVIEPPTTTPMLSCDVSLSFSLPLFLFLPWPREFLGVVFVFAMSSFWASGWKKRREEISARGYPRWLEKRRRENGVTQSRSIQTHSHCVCVS